jgi:hypothetical protein
MVLAGAGGAAMANWYQANRQAPQLAIPYRFQILDEYGVTADGQRFLVAEPIRARGTPPINVLVNWSPRLP